MSFPFDPGQGLVILFRLARVLTALLGLDFLRGEILTVDFRNGRVTLS
jgi:hypothetical protein